MADIDIHDLTDRYVAVWNEPDGERRRAAIRALWSADAVHVLQPPKEILQTAEGLGFERLLLQAHGHREGSSAWRAPTKSSSRRVPSSSGRATTPTGSTTSSSSTGRWPPGAVVRPCGVGLEILVLGPDGRIVSDYQFIEG